MFLVFALGSNTLLMAEVRAFRSSAGSDVPTIDGAQALSLAGVHQQLEQCELQMYKAARPLRDDAGRKRLAVHCQIIAGQILTTMPSQSFAHLVLARAADLTGTTEATRAHMHRSAVLAPHEGWLAKRRFRIAIAGTGIGSKSMPPVRHEIPVLMSFQSGVELLASTYVKRPDLREAIRSAAQSAGAEEQQQLIWQIEKATRLF